MTKEQNEFVTINFQVSREDAKQLIEILEAGRESLVEQINQGFRRELRALVDSASDVRDVKNFCDGWEIKQTTIEELCEGAVKALRDK